MDGNNSNPVNAARDSGYFSGSQSVKKSLNNNTGNGAGLFTLLNLQYGFDQANCDFFFFRYLV